MPISFTNSRFPCFDLAESCLTAITVPSDWRPCIWETHDFFTSLNNGASERRVTIGIFNPIDSNRRFTTQTPCKQNQNHLPQFYLQHQSCLWPLWFALRWIYQFAGPNPLNLRKIPSQISKHVEEISAILVLSETLMQTELIEIFIITILIALKIPCSMILLFWLR